MYNFRIIKLPEVQFRTGLSRSTIYFKMEKDTFPKPIKLSERSVGWIESEIQDWLNNRITVSRGGVCND